MPGLEVRPARFDADAEFMVSAVRRFLNPAADMRRFEWLYRRNPAGVAKAWIAEHAAEGPVGMAAAFPRRAYVAGGEETVWILGDFCVAERYRTLGPALQLQRTCLSGIGAGGAGLAYDLPAESILPVYRRLGIPVHGHVRRFAKPLRVDRWLPRRLPTFTRNVLAGAANRILGLFDSRHVVSGDLAVTIERRPCGQEFTDLARTLGAAHGFCLSRTASYLNWRYLDAPYRSYRVLGARRQGTLVGYAVLERGDDVGWVVDLFCADRDVVRSLISSAVRLFRAEGLATATIALLQTHPWARELADLGFRAREAAPFILCGGDAWSRAAGGDTARFWLLVQGDRES